MQDNILPQIEGKNVLFITTKNLDYIRNRQEIVLLQKNARSLKIIGSQNRRYFFRLFSVYTKLLFTPLGRYDVIFIGFAPQLVLPLFCRKFRKKKIVVDFFISLYDTMVRDRQKFKSGSLIGRFLLYLDKMTADRADFLIVDTRADAAYFESAFSVPREKIAVYYLEATGEVFYEMPQIKAPPFREKFIVHYFGSILPLQGVDVILRAARLLQDEDDIRFDIVGPVPKKERKAFGNPKNMEFTPWLPQKELARHIADADLCLAGHFNAQIEKASRTVPGKAAIYETMGKPMILGDNPANHERFSEDSRHFYVKMGNPEALAGKIRELRTAKWANEK